MGNPNLITTNHHSQGIALWDVDGPAPGEVFRFDEDEEGMHRPAVKSELNDALPLGKKVPATSSPSKPSSSTVKPTTHKSRVKLVPVTISSKTWTKNKITAKELEPQLSPLAPLMLKSLSPSKPHKSSQRKTNRR